MRTRYLIILLSCLLFSNVSNAQANLEMNGPVTTYRLYGDSKGTSVSEFSIENRNGRLLFSSDQFNSELLRKRGRDYYFGDDSKEYAKLRFDFWSRIRLYTKGTMNDVIYMRGYYQCTNHWPYHTSPTTNGFQPDCIIRWKWYKGAPTNKM